MSEANKLRVLYFLVFSCTASWLPLFADYLKSRGMTGMEIGILLSITPVMMFLVQPVTGMVADRWGYKRTLTIALLLSAIFFGLFFTVSQFYAVLAITMSMAVFYNTLQPLLDSLSLQLAERDRTFSYGTLRIAGAAGWAFTGIVVGQLVDVVNTSVIFAFSAVTLLLAFVFSFAVRESPHSALNAGSSFAHIQNIFGSRVLIVVLICVALVSTGATTIWNFYSIYMKENGASASLVGVGISFQGICELPFFYFSAAIIRSLGIRTTLLLTVLATSLRLFLYALVSDPRWAIAIEILHGVSWSLFWVVCVECVNGLVPERWRATGQSLLYASYFGIGAIAGNFWTGYLYDERLPIARIFFINGFVVAAVGLMLMIILRKRDLSAERSIQEIRH